MGATIMVKANQQTEAGILPDKKVFEMMHNFNEQLVRAGMMLAGEGLQPGVKGKRDRKLREKIAARK